MNNKRIVILGGGTGGIILANELRMKLSGGNKIILVERNYEHAFAPSFLWLMTGDRSPEKITKPLHRLIRPGVELIHAEVTHIDISNRRVTTSKEDISFDYLVIALGAELAPDLVPGLTDAAYSFYDFHETKKLRKALDEFNSGKIAVVVSSLPYKCPGAPHEAAMLIADYFRRRGIRLKVDIHLYTPEPQPMPVAGPKLGEAVTQMLQSKGISFHPLHKLNAVDPQTRELFFDGREAVGCDLLVAIPPHRSPGVVRESNLANDSGWIPVDPFTLKTAYDNVYAIGDITAISIPGRWKPDTPMMLPKAGVFAHAQAEVVAQRLVDEINGQTPKANFLGSGYCMLEAGESLSGFAYGDFFAEPNPKLELRRPGKIWHFGKVLFEKWWLSPIGLRKSVLHSCIKFGTKFLKIPVNV